MGARVASSRISAPGRKPLEHHFLGNIIGRNSEPTLSIFMSLASTRPLKPLLIVFQSNKVQNKSFHHRN